MKTRRHRTRNGTDTVPRDTYEAANQDARRAWLEIADELPGGRKTLGGRLAHRAALMARGLTTPTAGDWRGLFDTRGANRPAIIAYQQGLVDDYEGAPVLDDVEVCVGDLALETGQAVQAVLRAHREPTPEHESAATDEVLDVVLAADRLLRTRGRHARRQHEQRALGPIARGRLGLPTDGPRAA